jgi:hypothetical protein
MREEAERKAEQEEFARQQAQEAADEEELNPAEDNRSDLQKLKDLAKEKGVPEADIKKAGKSKVKLNELIAAADAEGDSSGQTGENGQEQDETAFME